ncbi:hypothetical protein VPH35_025443 [Triticum aestivum]
MVRFGRIWPCSPVGGPGCWQRPVGSLHGCGLPRRDGGSWRWFGLFHGSGRTSPCFRRKAGPLPPAVHLPSRARCRGTDLVSCPAAGPSSSRARQQDRPRLAPGCRTEPVSRPVQQDKEMEAHFGRPLRSRRWGSPRDAKAGTFPFVSLGGVVCRSRVRWCQGLGCQGSGPGGGSAVCSWAELVAWCCLVTMAVWAAWMPGCGVRWW